MPCAASGDDGIAWQATHQFCYLVPQRTAFHSRVSRNVLASEERHRHEMKTCQDVLSTLSRRGWRDAQRLLELRNPKPSRLHHSVASRRRACRARRRVLPIPEAPGLSIHPNLENRESCRNRFLGLLHFVIVEKSVTVEIT